MAPGAPLRRAIFLSSRGTTLRNWACFARQRVPAMSVAIYSHDSWATVLPNRPRYLRWWRGRQQLRHDRREWRLPDWFRAAFVAVGISEATINPSGFGLTSTPSRYSPDVSLLASPNFPGYLVCTNSAVLGGTGSSSTCDSPTTGITDMLNACFAGTEPCSIFGGTSVSTPVFAGMVTLLNQYLAASEGLGNINPILYSLAAANSTNHAFNPVTTASTGSYSDGALCQPGTPTSGRFGRPLASRAPVPEYGREARTS